ncbi:MAG: PaaI family thioesterase [Candidatus Sericytochromatia bacterium]
MDRARSRTDAPPADRGRIFSTEQLRLSPVHERLQLTVVRAEPGVAVLSMPLTDDIKGVYEGTVHGGMLATFADAACASCLWGTYDFGTQLTVTTDIHVRYYRQPKGGPLIAEAKMVHKGRRLLSAECVVVDAADRVLIRSTATFMLVEAGD